MRVEETIGRRIAHLREAREMSLAELGRAVGGYLEKPWSRQAVHQAERGRRAFTATELTAIALALDTSVPALFLADADEERIEMPGRTISSEEYRGVILHADKETPLDGVEELIVALHDIGEVLHRPALVRLAKIGRVAGEIDAPRAEKAGAAAEGARG